MLENKCFKIGRGRPVIKCKIKNLLKNIISIVNINERSKFNQVFINKKQVQFLYINNQNAFFADQKTFEMFEMDIALISDELRFMTAGCVVELRLYDQKPIILVLPTKLKLTVVETDENVNTSNNINRSMKNAKLNSGYELKVPTFIKINEQIYVSTDSGKYHSRAHTIS